MELGGIFREYEFLVADADEAFRRIEERHPDCVNCRIHCCDCCYAVFGLFLIEAAYLQYFFAGLDSTVKAEVLMRSDAAQRDLQKMERRLQESAGETGSEIEILGRERIRCPLLDDNDDCVLYPYRPITCRVYGVPTKVQGKARVCRLAGFERGEHYPVYDLDDAYRDLYTLSMELLEKAGNPDKQKAALLISVPKALTTPLEGLAGESLEQPGGAP